MVLLMLCMLGPSTSFGGEIREMPEHPKCDFLYFGEIIKGDAQKIEDAIETTASGSEMCFDSPGGDFHEGMRLFHTIWNKDILRTRVANGHVCLSACAIAFMGGSMRLGTGVIRGRQSVIEPKAKLGFGIPRLNLPDNQSYPPEAVEASYAFALETLTKLFQISQINEDGTEGLSEFLFGKTIEATAKTPYAIDTIGKASLAQVPLAQIPIRDINWNSI